MDVAIILENLHTKYLGKNIIFYEVMSSTQKEAKVLARENIQNGTVVITNMQTEGTGTHGRTWIAYPSKNILMTLIIYPDCNINKLEGLTLEIAKCLQNVIKELYNISLNIKEPNDLIFNNKKIGGILTETKTKQETARELFIGIGFNVNQEKFPEELKEIATSLKKETEKEFQREEIIAEFLNKFEEIIDKKIG